MALAGGSQHSLALRSDGTVWAWGAGANGQLGDGTNTDRTTPVQVSGLNNATAVAAAHLHSLALRSDGTVWAWGSNTCGQLGDGTTTSRNTPVKVAAPADVHFRAIATGGNFQGGHSLAVTDTGQVYAWGDNSAGQLGNGTAGPVIAQCGLPNPTPSPVLLPPGTKAVAVAAGGGASYFGHSVALMDDGTVYEWGDNTLGQTGSPALGVAPVPLPVAGLRGKIATAVAAGGAHTLALVQDGTVWAWGNNLQGELGSELASGTNAPLFSFTPTQVPVIQGVKAVAAGLQHSLAVTDDGVHPAGSLWAWGVKGPSGATYYGQTGCHDDGGGQSVCAGSLSPVQVRDPSQPGGFVVDVTAVGAGLYHSLASTVGSVAGGAFKLLPPTRILDTRPGSAVNSNGTPLAAGQSLDVAVTGVGGVPASGVSAVVMNVTAVTPTAAGWLTLWPTGAPQPLASNLNFDPGETNPNLVEVPVGSGGKVSVAFGSPASSGAVHVLFDVAGWVTTPSPTAGPDGLYNALPPTRVLDTRASSQVGPRSTPLAVDADFTLAVAGTGGVPASGAQAVVANVTVTNVNLTTPGESCWLTVYPGGGAAPTASNLNFVGAQEVANRVAVPLGGGGISFHLGCPTNDGSTVDVVADVGGWFTSASSGAGGARYRGLAPVRLADTRAVSQIGPRGTPLGAGESMVVPVAGTAGVPANATAVVLNVTVTDTTARSWLTVWPSGESQPTASDLNWGGADTRPNLVVARVGPDGAVNIANANGAADVIVDVQGWYG